MKTFTGIRPRKERFYDKCEIVEDGDAIILGVISREYRTESAMSLTPKTAREIAAELIRLADMLDVAQLHRLAEIVEGRA